MFFLIIINKKIIYSVYFQARYFLSSENLSCSLLIRHKLLSGGRGRQIRKEENEKSKSKSIANKMDEALKR